MTPGLGIIRAVFMKLFKNYELALVFFFILMTASSKVLFFYLARRLLPFEAALLAALIWVFYPPGWFYGSQINPHTYTTDFLVVALALLFLAWDRKSFLLCCSFRFISRTMALMTVYCIYIVF